MYESVYAICLPHLRFRVWALPPKNLDTLTTAPYCVSCLTLQNSICKVEVLTLLAAKETKKKKHFNFK